MIGGCQITSIILVFFDDEYPFYKFSK